MRRQRREERLRGAGACRPGSHKVAQRPQRTLSDVGQAGGMCASPTCDEREVLYVPLGGKRKQKMCEATWVQMGKAT